MSQGRVMEVAGGAVGADGIVTIPHVDEGVRMVEWRKRSSTHEFTNPDPDGGHAGFVVEMRRVVEAGHRLQFRTGAFAHSRARQGRIVGVRAYDEVIK